MGEVCVLFLSLSLTPFPCSLGGVELHMTAFTRDNPTALTFLKDLQPLAMKMTEGLSTVAPDTLLELLPVAISDKIPSNERYGAI